MAATIHKAWVQTWLAGGVRQERAAFRVTTTQEQLRIKLPASPTAGSVQAAINAQPAQVAVREPPALLVDVPAAVHGQEGAAHALAVVVHGARQQLLADAALAADQHRAAAGGGAPCQVEDFAHGGALADHALR